MNSKHLPFIVIAAVCGLLLLATAVSAAPLAQVDLSNGLVAYWNLNEESGTRDDAAGSNDLSDNNTVGYATGKLGNAANFNGSSTEYLQAGNSLLGAEWSISGWSYVASGAAFGYVLADWSGTGNQRSMALGSNGQLTYSSDGTASTTIGSAWSYNTWHFWAITYNNGSITLTIDGATNSYSGTIYNGTAATTLGALSGSGTPFTGKTDAVGIWNRALSADEITALYNNGNGVEYPFTALTPTPTNTATPTATPTATSTPTGQYTVDFADGEHDWIGTAYDQQTTPAYHTTSGTFSSSCSGLGPGYWQSTEAELTNSTFNEWYNYVQIESTHKLSFSGVTVHRIGYPDSIVNWVYVYVSDDGVNWATAGSNSNSNNTGCYAQSVTASVSNKYVRILYQHRYNGSQVQAGIYKLVFSGYTDHGGPTPTPTPTATPVPCTTIDNPGFIDDSRWLFESGAAGRTATDVFTNGVVSMAIFDRIEQSNVELKPDTSYNAVIKITRIHEDTAEGVDNTPALAVGLIGASGTNYSQISIPATGTYTITLQSGSDLYSDYFIEYSAENGSDLDLDYTCLYPNTDPDTGGPRECLGPANGDFTNGTTGMLGSVLDGWTLHGSTVWDASWGYIIFNFPHEFSSYGPAVSDGSFTLPTITGTQKIMAAFDSWGQRGNNTVRVGLLIDGDSTDSVVSSTVQTRIPVGYAFDISSMAGETIGVTVGTEIVNLLMLGDKVSVDNVCIYIDGDGDDNTDGPTDTRANPIDFGFNFDSCADIDGLWAGLGINMAQYRAIYNDGFFSPWYLLNPALLLGTVLGQLFSGASSNWDPFQWLAAAFWVLLSDASCFFMAALAYLVDVLEAIATVVVNYFNWLVGAFEELGRWLSVNGNKINFSIVKWFSWMGMKLDAFFAWLNTGWDVFWEWVKNTAIDGWEIVKSAWETVWDIFDATVIQYIRNQFNAAMTVFDFVIAIGELIKTLTLFVWESISMYGRLPLTFYSGFNDGFSAAPYNNLIACNGNVGFWCVFLGGVQVVNQTTSHTIVYPILIVAMIVSTVAILWRDIRSLSSK